ncbi:RHS repeat-associated core domain-containing protein [Pokkaliibacter sp. MBI-7]|uniref:RHS repeat-associated core domain-containing protein n=1 Tax=Pokkaliibacter sp. MBI-7 TaxID=3040600 RepID=UPI00244829CD|nr:RHS repeat-associated core domain-containing protein [Pokkaliibacter sp. MBI-7]MDH2431079.1 RHS repeat-associated core domain-containing protein [Pokkaliibacter sp. MBI-7]
MLRHVLVNSLYACLVLMVIALQSSQAGSVTYVYTDHLGSPLVEANSAGVVIDSAEYGVYGNKVTGAVNAGPGYAGHSYDPTLGLTYMRARYYDSDAGRFLSRDPIQPTHEGNLYSINRYAYANNNPYRFIDPKGQIPLDTIWDVANVIYDIARIGYGYVTNNSDMVSSATIDLGADTTAAAVPYLPAGVTKILSAGAGLGKLGSNVTQKAPVHHICTNKNCISAASGGPWTPRFQEIFNKAGIGLDDAINKVAVPGHQGPHPEAYHSYVYKELLSATRGLEANTSAYQNAVTGTLDRIRMEATTVGSQVNRWLTNQ